MLDILLSRLKEEIAIDGASGSSIGTVWEYVESISKDIASKAGTSVSPLVDDRYKSFIWNYLKLEKDLEFYENLGGNQAPAIETANQTNAAVTNYQGPEQAMEIDDGLIDNNEINVSKVPESELLFPKAMKRKKPTGSKEKATAKKKAKPKQKPKKKKKAPARKSAGNSDDDFEGGSDSASSSEESDFEQDISDEEDNEDENSEPEQNKKHKTSTVPKQQKKATGESKRISANVTLSPIDVSDLTFEQITEKYQNRFHITGSIEFQERQLLVGLPPGVFLSPNLTIILKEIIKTRSKGLFQANVTKVLNIDSRSTGHYCKSLEEKGAIVRNGVSTNKFRTNVCTHVRFVGNTQIIDIADESIETIPYNVNSKGEAYSQIAIRDAIIDLIKDAPAQAMLSEDILRALGFNGTRRVVRKWFNRVIDELCGAGYIKKTDVKINGKGPARRCLHLLKTPTPNERAEDLPLGPLDFPIRIKTMKEDIPILHVLIDSSLESQILQVLQASGENGATQREIGFALNLDENRILYKLLDKMVELEGVGLERFGALRYLEFEGKQRRYRYFTYKAYKKKYENLEVEFQPLPAELDESTFCDKSYFKDVPHSLKEFQRFIVESKNPESLRVITKKGHVLTPPKKIGRPKKIIIAGQPPPKKSPYVKKIHKTPASKENVIESAETAPASEPAVSALEANIIPEESSPISEDTVSNVSISEGAPDLTTAINEPRPAANKSHMARFFDRPKRGRPEDTGEKTTKKTKHIQESSVEANVQTSIEPIANNEDGLINTNLTDESPATSMDIDTTLSLENNTPEVQAFSAIEFAPAPKPVPSPNSIPITESASVVEDKNPVQTTVVSEPLPITDSTSDMSTPASTHQTSMKGLKSTAKKDSAATPPARKLRNRTIADYFTKRVKVTPEPKVPDIPEQVTTTSNSETTSVDSPSSSPTPSTSTEAIIRTNIASEPAIDLFETTTVAQEQTAFASDPMIVTSETTPIETSGISTDVSQNVTEGSDVDTTILTQSQSLPPKASNNSFPESLRVIKPTDVTEPTIPVSQVKHISTEVPAMKTFSQAKAGFKPGATHNRPNQINVYMEARAKILLALLEDRPMWEMNKDLMDAYLVKAREINGDFKYTVCNKTLWRSAIYLSDKKEAQTLCIKSPLLYGGFNERKILIRNDIDVEGDECKGFQRRLSERRALQSTRVTPRTFDKIAMPVERLEGRITRLRSKLQHLEDENQLFEANQLKKHIGDLTYNAQHFKARETKRSPIGGWQIRAMQFGWVRARMLRIKLLYMEMFNVMMRDESLPGIDKEKRFISTVTFVTNMTVGAVCKIIGVFDPSQKLLDYLGDPAHFDILCSEMPEDVRKEFLSDTNRFRRKLRILLYGLEYLGLIVPGDSDKTEKKKYGYLSISYYLTRVVSIKDRKRIGQPVIREHAINNAVDANIFWSELQYTCTHMTDKIPPDEMEPPPTDPKEFEYWKGMYHANNWTICSVLLRSQRKILNSYVDKSNGTTPLNNNPVCRNIAEATSLTLYDVRRYYMKVETAITQKKEHRARKGIESRLYPSKRRSRKIASNREGRRVINLSSTRAFNSHDKSRSLGLKARFEKGGTHEPLEGEDTYLDNFTSTPVIIGAPSAIDMRVKRNKRLVWTEEEDDLLVYCYIILRQRTPSLIRWHTINHVFSTKPPAAGRHRIAKLLADPHRAEQLESAAILWRRYYSEGLQRGEIEDPDPREIINFDLLSLLSYFLKRLNENETHIQMNILPKNPSDISRLFDITYNDGERRSYRYEDIYFAKCSTAARVSLMTSKTFTGRRLLDSDCDDPPADIALEDSISERQVKLMTGFSMMTLMTPTEVYDPFFAYAIINSYPPHLLDAAVHSMREKNCLINSKQERSIPGTKFSMSARFNTLMCGVFPMSLFKQAQEYDKYLSSQSGKSRIAPEFISSGMMACIMDLLSDDKINVVMANKESRFRFFKTMSFSNRLTDRALTIFQMDVEKKEPTRTDNIKVDPKELKITCQDKLKLDVEFGHFLKSKDVNTEALLRRIISALKIRGGLGLTLYQLKVEIGSKYDDVTIKRGIDLLESNDPAFICPVGFGALRYVAIEYIDSWSMNTKEHMKLDLNSLRPETQDFTKSFDGLVRKEILLPNIWTDINGNRTDLIVRDCKKVLVEFVMRRPGTSEAHIHETFKAAFERTALRTLLDVLVKENRLKRVQVTQCGELKARKSIFSKSHNFKCTKNTTIEEITRTFYFVQSNPSVNAIN